jgi:hypothetical protein
MKKEKSVRFDWSRNPSREGIHSVYIASPNSYAVYGRDISKEEMANSLATWSHINELAAKKLMFKRLFIATLVSFPFLVVVYNMVQAIITMNSK